MEFKGLLACVSVRQLDGRYLEENAFGGFRGNALLDDGQAVASGVIHALVPLVTESAGLTGLDGGDEILYHFEDLQVRCD